MTRIARTELFERVWTRPLSSVASELGLTANGLAKLCDRVAIPRPKRAHWTKPDGHRDPRPSLPPEPEGVSPVLTVGGDRPVVRRKRTRLSPEERHEQLLDTAVTIALEEGVQSVTLKRVASAAGISEAQAHNCFQGRLDLLLSLTRREIAIGEARRRERVTRGTDRMASIVMSTVSYLHESVERGPLLQMLLRNADIRAALREERSAATAIAREPSLRLLSKRYAMRREVANGSSAALTAVTLRAGGLLASGRTNLGVAERMCLAIVLAGARSNETWNETGKEI